MNRALVTGWLDRARFPTQSGEMCLPWPRKQISARIPVTALRPSRSFAGTIINPGTCHYGTPCIPHSLAEMAAFRVIRSKAGFPDPPTIRSFIHHCRTDSSGPKTDSRHLRIPFISCKHIGNLINLALSESKDGAQILQRAAPLGNPHQKWQLLDARCLLSWPKAKTCLGDVVCRVATVQSS